MYTTTTLSGSRFLNEKRWILLQRCWRVLRTVPRMTSSMKSAGYYSSVWARSCYGIRESSILNEKRWILLQRFRNASPMAATAVWILNEKRWILLQRSESGHEGRSLAWPVLNEKRWILLQRSYCSRRHCSRRRNSSMKSAGYYSSASRRGTTRTPPCWGTPQ